VQGDVVSGVFGTGDAFVASAPLAELQACAEALQVALPPFRLIYDCELISKGLKRGESWCVRPNRTGAKYWTIIWRCLNDMEVGSESFFSKPRRILRLLRLVAMACLTAHGF
jgi:hypothetical protein